jgi:hypothetical protein
LGGLRGFKFIPTLYGLVVNRYYKLEANIVWFYKKIGSINKINKMYALLGSSSICGAELENMTE